jgi:hypothetical protein
MPLVGIVDPSHSATRAYNNGKLPSWFTLDELYAKATEAGPKWAPWTVELITAALAEHQERGDRISTSLLTGGCPRGSVLERMVDWVGNLDTMYASLRGTLLHKVLQDYARPTGIAEVRFYTTVDEVEFSCSPDLLTQDAVWDYKMTELPPTFGYPYRHHTEQLMFNAFVVRHAEKWEQADGSAYALPWDPREQVAKQVVAVYLGPKGPKPITYEKKTVFINPKGHEVEGNQPYVFSDDEVLEILRPRLHGMVRAFESFPKWPEGLEEVWGGAPSYRCPGWPLCKLPNCLAKREPEMYAWPREG